MPLHDLELVAPSAASGFVRIASGTPILPMSWNRPAKRSVVEPVPVEPELPPDLDRDSLHALRVAGGVRILRVDRLR